MSEYTVSTELKAKTGNFKNQIRNSINLLKRYEKYIKTIKDIELKANSADLQKSVEVAKKKLQEIDKKKVKAQLIANTKDAEIKLKRFKEGLQVIDRKVVMAKAEVNTKNAIEKMIQHKKALDYINNKTIMTSIDLNNASFKSKFVETKKKLNELDKTTVKTAIEVNNSVANAEIKTFKARLRSVPNVIHTRLKISNHGGNFLTKLNNQCDVFQSRMDRIAKSINTFGTIFGNVIKGTAIASFSGLIPIVASLVPVIMAIGNSLAVVGGGVIGLAGMFGIAGVSAIGFGVMAKQMLSYLEDGTLIVTSEVVRFKGELESLRNTWNNVLKVNQASVFNTLSNSLNTLGIIIKKISPFIEETTDAIADASLEMMNWVNSNEVASRLFDELNSKGVKTFQNLLKGVGGFTSGFINMFTQFMPLFAWVSEGFANMGKAFEEWANKVSTQQGINTFIDYVKTNLPIIGQIFGDTFMGLFNLFKAFGSNSNTVLEGLSEMANKFREWSESISSSDAFNKFIDYIQQNAPQILSLIGNIIMALVNFSVAMAPIGSAVLSVVTSITEFIAKLFETNPAIAQVLGVLVSFGGLLMAIIPQIVGFTSFFAPLITKFLELSNRFGIIKTVALLLGRAFTILSGACMTLTSPIMIIVAVLGILIGIFVYLWNTNETFRQKVIEIWTTISEVISSVINVVVGFVMGIWGMLVSWWQENNQLIMEAVTVVWDLIGPYIMNAINIIVAIIQAGWSIVTTVIEVAWTVITTIIETAINIVLNIITLVMQLITCDWTGAWETIKNIALTLIQALCTIVTSIFEGLVSILSAIWDMIVSIAKSLWQTLKDTIIDKIKQAYAIVTSVVRSIWSMISSKFSEIVQTVIIKMAEFFNAIKNKVQDAYDAVVDFASDFISAGRDLIMGLINGVKEAAGKLIDAVTDVVEGAIDAAKSLLGIKSPSRVFKAIGLYTMQGLNNGITEEGSSVISNVANIAKRMTQNFNPDLTVDMVGIQSNLGNLNANVVKHVKHTHDIQTRPGQRVVRIEMDINNEALTTIVNNENANRNDVFEF